MPTDTQRESPHQPSTPNRGRVNRTSCCSDSRDDVGSRVRLLHRVKIAAHRLQIPCKHAHKHTHNTRISHDLEPARAKSCIPRPFSAVMTVLCTSVLESTPSACIFCSSRRIYRDEQRNRDTAEGQFLTTQASPTLDGSWSLAAAAIIEENSIWSGTSDPFSTSCPARRETIQIEWTEKQQRSGTHLPCFVPRDLQRAKQALSLLAPQPERPHVAACANNHNFTRL